MTPQDNDANMAVHLDTSIQMERCKSSPEASRVREYLKLFKVTTSSSYARIEFLRAWIQRLVFLHGVLTDVSNLGEAMKLLESRLKNQQHLRQYKTRLQALFAVMETTKSSDLESRAALVRVRKNLQERIIGWNYWWQHSITHGYDGTKCARATIRPKVRSNGDIDAAIPQCRRTSIHCCIDQFVTRNKSHLDSIANAVKSDSASSSGLKKIAETIQSCVNDPQMACDDRICRRLGDAIIAIDSGGQATLAANNDTEWILLASVLGRKLDNPVREIETSIEVDVTARQSDLPTTSRPPSKMSP